MSAPVVSRRVSALLVAGIVSAVMVAAIAYLPSGAPADGAPAGGATSGTTVPQDPAAAATSYLSAVEPLARDGGRIVEQGMKAGLVDIAQGGQPDDLLIDSAKAWADQMRQVRARWRDVEPPPGLADAHEGFLGALDRYVGVAIVLEEAARVPPEERGPFIDLAESEGTLADEDWDDAGSQVQDHLRSLGLDPVTWLPDEPDLSGTEPSTGTS